MARQPENSPEKANFFLNALNKYGRYMYLPGEPIPGYVVTDLYTINVLERIEVNGIPGEGLQMRRAEPTAPVDFLEYKRRRN